MPGHVGTVGAPPEAFDVTETVSSDMSRFAPQAVAAHSNVVDANGIGGYIIPITVTDYVGLETVDPRLMDREWRLNHLYKVINENGELVPFRLREAQRELLRGMHYKNIILKARQLGFTTFICIFMLDYALFHSNKQIGIIAHTVQDASVIFRKIAVAWEYFPQHIKDYFSLRPLGDSKSEYQFSNGSIVRVMTSMRSGTYQMVLITEFGKTCAQFPEKGEEIVNSMPAVPPKGVIFIESTAEGETGRFYDMCQDAMETRRLSLPLTVKDFKFFFFPWYQNPANVVSGMVPVSDEVNAYLDKVQRLSRVTFTQEQRNWYFLEQRIQKSKMKQEHPSTPEESFLVSGNKMFSPEVIDAMRIDQVRDPISTDGDFRIYAKYVKSHRYGLGADVSMGIKRDHSTIVVIDFTTGEVVLTYKSNTIDPVNFAHEIKKAGSWYGVCIAAPEANNVGITVCVQLNAVYPNVFTQVREGVTEVVPSNKLGWLSTSLSKPKMLYELSDAFDEGALRCPDEGILLEAKKFDKEDALEVKTTDKTTRHFDLLTACAIAWQMRIYSSKGLQDEATVAEREHRREERRSRTRSNFR